MFNWLFRTKPEPKPEPEPEIGRYYAIQNCPFIEYATIATVLDIKDGWLKYSFWHKGRGVDRSVNIAKIDVFCSTYKFEVTDKVKEYESKKGEEE